MYEMNNPTPNNIDYNKLLENIIDNPNLIHNIKNPAVIKQLITNLAYDYNESDGKGFWNTITLGGNMVGGIGGKWTSDSNVKKLMEALNQAYSTVSAAQAKKIPANAKPSQNQGTAKAQQDAVKAQAVAQQTAKAKQTAPTQATETPTGTQQTTSIPPFQFSGYTLNDLNRLRDKMLWNSMHALQVPNQLKPFSDWNSLNLPSLSGSLTPITGRPLTGISGDMASGVIKSTIPIGNALSPIPVKMPTIAPAFNPNDPKYKKIAEDIKAAASKITATPPKENKLGGLLNQINQYLPTIGDALSAYGAYKGMKDAQRYTLENRATDTPNINPYAEYGAKSLAESDNAYSYLQRMRSSNNNELQGQAVSSANQISNNTLSNGMRQSMLAANYANTLKGINDMNNNINTQEMSLMDRRSALLQDIDRMVMQGEAQRDLADRQDKDAFYTNLSRNATDYATGLQHLGGMFNRHKENITNSNLLAQLSQYGFALDPKTGRLFKKD